jgi:hypothetical protein
MDSGTEVGGGVEHHGIAHFPELVLVSSATRGHSGSGSVGMKVQRQVAADEAHFAGVDVFLL